jgi:hypothetical protein
MVTSFFLAVPVELTNGMRSKLGLPLAKRALSESEGEETEQGMAHST